MLACLRIHRFASIISRPGVQEHKRILAKSRIVIISPALAKANNGYWQTARRWAYFLQQRFRVEIALDWDGTPADAMLALHARRSAQSVTDFAARCPGSPLVLALTGTDLYRDIDFDTQAQESLQLATHLEDQQEAGLRRISPELRRKAHENYQSAAALKPAPVKRNGRHADVIMIGHLRDEKDPATFMRAAGLSNSGQARFTHIGGARGPAGRARAMETQQRTPRYRWLGNLPHAKTRQMLKRARLMALTSRMEGGANVIIEAVTSGVPVLASDIEGNCGMLGDDYAGYFPVGNSAALAALIDRALADPGFDAQLRRQCAARAFLFTPECELVAVCVLLDNALNPSRTSSR